MRTLIAKVARLIPMRRARDREAFARFMEQWAAAQTEMLARAEAVAKAKGAGR